LVFSNTLQYDRRKDTMLRGEDEEETPPPSSRVSPRRIPPEGSNLSSFGDVNNSAPVSRFQVSLPTGMLPVSPPPPNPAAQPQWLLGKDPDPMMQAL